MTGKSVHSALPILPIHPSMNLWEGDTQCDSPVHCPRTQETNWSPQRIRAWTEDRAMYIWNKREADSCVSFYKSKTSHRSTSTYLPFVSSSCLCFSTQLDKKQCGLKSGPQSVLYIAYPFTKGTRMLLWNHRGFYEHLAPHMLFLGCPAGCFSRLKQPNQVHIY